jgi:hypothetical protein
MLSIHSLPSHSTLLHSTYFTVMCFIFISKVNVQRDFLMNPSYEYPVLCSVSIPSVTPPYPFPPNPYYSTALSMYCYVTYLHRCNIDIVHFHSLFLSFFPELHRVVTQLQIYSTYKCVYNHVCLVYTFMYWTYFNERKYVAFFFLILA